MQVSKTTGSDRMRARTKGRKRTRGGRSCQEEEVMDEEGGGRWAEERKGRRARDTGKQARVMEGRVCKNMYVPIMLMVYLPMERISLPGNGLSTYE